MSGSSPSFKRSYSQEELVEHCLLTPADVQLAVNCRGATNRCAVALLLKTLEYRGYLPPPLERIPREVRSFIAGQRGLLWDFSEPYLGESRTREQHLALIPQPTGWRSPSTHDKAELEHWLRTEAAWEACLTAQLFTAACQRLRAIQGELPTEGELERVVNAALSGFFQDMPPRIAVAIPPAVRPRMDSFLLVPASKVVSPFETMKAEPGKPGVANFQAEMAQLQALRGVGLERTPFVGVPWKVRQMLKRRASNEKASERRDHPDGLRYALGGCFLQLRSLAVTDDVTRMASELIHRLDARSENQLYRALRADLKRVDGKIQILSRIPDAVGDHPEGLVREGIFPQVKEETFRHLKAEFASRGAQLRLLRQTLMQRKFRRPYRRMLPVLLENLHFGSEPRFQPLLEALAVLRRHLGGHQPYFSEEGPLEGVVTPAWKEKVFEEGNGATKVVRRYYELCVLQTLQRALKGKEVWVEGAQAFRNPSEDLPGDWADEQRRQQQYHRLGKPLDAAAFIHSLQERLTTALPTFNERLPQLPPLRLFHSRKHAERGLWTLTKLERHAEPQSLPLSKEGSASRQGRVDLLDVFVEADRLGDFTRFFTHSGTKEGRSREAVRPLLILDLFAEGTNRGIRRVANANDRYSYEELLYVRKTYFSPEALRNAKGAVVNKLLAFRNPQLWGEGASSCASDAPRVASWRQNLMTEGRSRYKGYGGMVYWHGETNAVCLYSQLKSFSNSEVAARIEGLIRPDTERRGEKNFGDSHGPSEVAFAFCSLLGTLRLMPRLQRLTYERLSLPDKGRTDAYPNLAGTFARPLRWEGGVQQYDEMIKSTVALQRGTATAEAILKRDNSYTVTHPTYKALAEIGKAEKTLFLCDSFSSRETPYEVHGGLNVVENWNATTDFLASGRQGE